MLESAALHYLERFAASSTLLRRTLIRKAARSAAHWGEDPDQSRALVDQVVEKMVRLGYVDDAAYALMKARSLHGRGKGVRVIRADLASRGVGADQAALALQDLQDDVVPVGGDLDLMAAWALAKKRRLGPYRPAEQRSERRRRDLAVLGRAGFDFDTARAVIDAPEEPE